MKLPVKEKADHPRSASIQVKKPFCRPASVIKPEAKKTAASTGCGSIQYEYGETGKSGK